MNDRVATRVLGIDPGERRVGVALSDPIGIIASPLMVIDLRTENLAEVLRSLCEAHDVGRVVVGLPIGLSGEEGPAATKARRLAAVVEEATGLPVDLHDERFTSVTAEGALLEGGVKRRDRRETRDKVAAAVMLQSFLDSRRAHDTGADDPS